MEIPIQIEDVDLAIKSLKNNKCPSTDGLPIEFYKTFWGKLSPILTQMLVDTVEKKKFHLTAREGILSLLEKVGRNSLLIDNWCPLTLLNVDYKIFTKILANRLNLVANRLIHPIQTGFLPGRHISDNIVKLLNIMDHCQKSYLNAIIMSFNFYKAFDTVSWATITQVMEYLGFGPICWP